MRRVRRVEAIVPMMLAMAACGAPSGPHGLTAVPVALRLTSAGVQPYAGGLVDLTVTLQNADRQDTPALNDTPVVLSSAPGQQDAIVVVAAGASRASLVWRPPVAGLFWLQATATDLPADSLLVPVEPTGDRILPSEWPTTTVPQTPVSYPPKQPDGIFSRWMWKVVNPGTPETPQGTWTIRPHDLSSIAPTSAFSAAAPTGLGLEVNPVRVAHDAVASIVIVLKADKESAARAVQPIDVHLSARLGSLSASDVTIPAGQITSRGTPVTIHSARPGLDVVSVISTVGNAEHEVHFEPPRAARLVVDAPPRAVSDGRTAAVISIRLTDGDNRFVRAEDDIEVAVSTTLGSLDARRVVIAKGSGYAETTLTAAARGVATVRATAPGLTEYRKVVAFSFPWVLVLIAAGCGVLGAYTKFGTVDADETTLYQNLFIGAVTGTVLWLAVTFGALRVVEALPFDLLKVPALTEGGAVLLGLIGGYTGRGLLDGPAGS